MPAQVRILALVYSIKEEEEEEEEKMNLKVGLFLVSRFLNAIERVERRNMFWHLGKRALIAANNRI